ncbi:YMGG-like glycine zipper-containing protein [Nitrosomonas sp. Nm132]|uniref:YMGG-like glycine zipper-containing protein n=1 Tax=Nitrosomonas sp. Nm132 TaxID=1881053 RepID=UPI00088EDC8D|nr:YMGG-like glycine zipper-containing protein [Nitrosomonas sp. Nm132]SDH91343.1 Glycine-zipper containing OmpA-like membrane domain-containing protein [Nitrosomonas sp. Nm132]
MEEISRLTYFLPPLLLVACVHIPSGPSVMVLPGAGKSFDQFRSDDYLCKQYASQQSDGQTPRQASVSSGVESAAVGAALGAAAGAAFGGGRGAAIGAGSGLLAGSLSGSETARTSGYISQQRYDMSYIQCMYASGHRVPVAGQFLNDPYVSQTTGPATQPSARSIPPPPPGNPPPPPSAD